MCILYSNGYILLHKQDCSCTRDSTGEYYIFILIVYQAIKLTILYHFAYLMYQSYKLASKQDENVKSKLFKYIMFIIRSSHHLLFITTAS